jgi:hypothetical protein
VRFKNVKHAEYKILQHMARSGSVPLSVVMNRGVPGYKLGAGKNQPLKKDDKVALGRFNTACKNLGSVLNNMMLKREKDVPEDDLDVVPSYYLDSRGSRLTEYEEEDDLYGEE